TIQFVELFTTADLQDQLSTHTLVASSDGNNVTFTFQNNLSSTSTANHRVLLATPGFSAICGGVTADYTIPQHFFNPAAATITLNFASGFDVETISGTLPTNGRDSLTDLVVGASSPTNF